MVGFSIVMLVFREVPLKKQLQIQFPTLPPNDVEKNPSTIWDLDLWSQVPVSVGKPWLLVGVFQCVKALPGL